MFSNWLTPSNAPPPDVLLEVGPPPYVRYAAHSALLSAHSGYLRSAMRPDDRSFDNPIYLPNITSEQFTPLLTYMYTGFLDLSIENIFAVLLATHVLHMPRASEICRSYLARTQAEGYLGGSFLASSAAAAAAAATSMHNDNNNEKSSVKVIRPIASKASGSGLAFIAPPMSSILLPSPDTPFKSLLHSSVVAMVEREQPQRSPVASTSKRANSVSPKEIVTRTITPQPQSKPMKKNYKSTVRMGNSSPPTQIPIPNPTPIPNHKRQSQSTEEKPRKKVICDIVEDPIKLDNNKIIIDIASCDGPVRFRRVLNEAYGRPGNNSASTSTKTMERSHQHVATSFHLQMAKTINEQRLEQQQSEESENSQQEINVVSTVGSSEPLASSHASGITKPSDEVYSCVYCKHTFKSQYCYQKHAKRHINPLTIDDTELIVETIDSGSEKDEKGSSSGGGGGGGVGGSGGGGTVRREVRPLDMNVQYYPCKTCGSKFPSYYFVHKHRKMCHANEEN